MTPRNPERIDLLLERIRVAWQQCPDLRLIQLLENSYPPGTVGYYLEDDKLLTCLEKEYPI